jgi:opacity protein-like surface antigen
MLAVRRLSGVLALLLVVSVLGTNVATAAAVDIRFEGSGWGHGVGLSQHGAKAMGADGATYDQILHRYFTGISLVPLSSTERESFLTTEAMPFWVGKRSRLHSVRGACPSLFRQDGHMCRHGCSWRNMEIWL